MRAARWVLVVAVVVLAVLSLDPALLGWSTTTGVAQLMGMRSWLMWGSAAVAAIALVVTIGQAFRNRFAARALVLVLVLGLVAGFHLLALGSRGLSTGEVPAAADEEPGEITVITANVRGDDADEQTVTDLVSLVAASGADVVALPEGQPIAADVAAALAEDGTSFQVFPAVGNGPNRGTALLVADSLGVYVEAEAPVGAVRVDAADGQGPSIAAVHPISLGVGPVRVEQWRSELAAVQALVRQMPAGIVAGDLNATVDHQPIRDMGAYSSGVATAGIGGYGTFPSWLPPQLGTGIDDVLVHRNVASVTGGGLVDIAGTDHRAVVLRLRPATTS